VARGERRRGEIPTRVSRRGEATKPTGEACVAVTEGEGIVAGLRKLKEGTAFGKYAKAV
jgi:hypothetical protein